VTSAKRSFIAPEVPTLAESGLAGYDISSWQALFAPAGIPKPVLDRLYAETAKALKAPDVAKRLQDLGLDAGGMTPDELGAKIRDDIPKLGKIVRDSGAKVD
jgi:tripartite-type tricarboxylate transporter receptor subunit TctC